MNSWGANAAHFDFGGNTPFNPVWNYQGTATDIHLPDELRLTDASNPVALASNYTHIKVHGSAIKVSMQTNEGYTESGNNATLGLPNIAFVKNWLMGIRPTNNFENLDANLFCREDMQGYPSFQVIKTSRHGRVTGKTYARTQAVLDVTRGAISYGYRFNNMNPSGSLGPGYFEAPTSTSASDNAPIMRWCWQVYYRPDILIAVTDDNISSPPTIMNVELTWYCEFQHRTQFESVNTNLATSLVNIQTPSPQVWPHGVNVNMLLQDTDIPPP